jgi:hypothetical protein
MPKLTFEQQQVLIAQFGKEIEVLSNTVDETMSFYEMEKMVEQTGKRILSQTLESLAQTPKAGIFPPMPALSPASAKKWKQTS